MNQGGVAGTEENEGQSNYGCLTAVALPEKREMKGERQPPPFVQSHHIRLCSQGPAPNSVYSQDLSEDQGNLFPT